MKKLAMILSMGCLLAIPTLPAFGDATTADKEQIGRARTEFQTAVASDEGCKAMCEEMMKNPRSKKMMCSMMAKDSECMEMMKK